MKTKRIICAFICAVMFAVTAMPTYALHGNHTDTHIEYGLGVKVKSTSSINTITASGSIQCSFVTGVAHLPASDYSCRITIKLEFSDRPDIVVAVGPDQVMNLTVNSELNGLLPEAASFNNYVNGSNVYHHEFS